MDHVNNCTWFFGDGTTLSLCGDVTHSYSVGWFTVKLELDTDLGYISTIEKKYYVKVYKARTTNFNAEFVQQTLMQSLLKLQCLYIMVSIKLLDLAGL